ncbi:hypothetical protein PSN_2829 [Pseudomonas sp. NGC7]
MRLGGGRAYVWGFAPPLRSSAARAALDLIGGEDLPSFI